MTTSDYRLTYEDAMLMVERYNDFNFYRKVHVINGYRVEVFNYFLCDYKMFVCPLSDRPHVNAFDMRGVTFVFNLDGSLYRMFLMLPKFFNMNEVESTQYDLIKDKPIRNITVKDDGSHVAFMRLPNEQVFAKTRGSLDNEQTRAAMTMYESDFRLRTLINKFLSAECTPSFEYVSFANKIVLRYNDEELKLIGIRSNSSFEYHSVARFDSNMMEHLDNNCIKHVSSVKDKSLDDLIELCEVKDDMEGFVIEFEDGQLMKLKTRWYFSRHKMCTENINREDYVIESYVNGTLDDMLSQFDPIKDSNVFLFVLNVKDSIQNFIKELITGTSKLYETFVNAYGKNLKEFAIAESRSPYFKFVKCLIDDDLDKTRCVKEINKYVLKRTYKLSDAREIAEQYKSKTDENISS